MQINKISDISFRDYNKELSSQDAILMLRDPNASVKFRRSQELAYNADLVSSNPFKAIGYKLYRTFNMIRESENPQTSEKLNVVA